MLKKRKNNLAFTLLELVGVIVVLALLLMIAIPGISKLLKGFRDDYYLKLQTTVLNAGESYISADRRKRPSKIFYSTVIPIKLLEENNFVEPILDYKNKACSEESYVVVVKTTTGGYTYASCLTCPGDGYKTELSKHPYCHVAWKTNDNITTELDLPNAVYIAKGSSLDKIRSDLGVKTATIKRDNEGNFLAGLPLEDSQIFYPTNLNQFVGENPKSGKAYYEFNGQTFETDVHLYQNDAPVVTMTNFRDGSIYVPGTISAVVKVNLSVGDEYFNLLNLNVAEYQSYNSLSNKWEKISSCNSGSTSCTFNYNVDMDANIKFRIKTNVNGISKESSSYHLIIDSTHFGFQPADSCFQISPYGVLSSNFPMLDEVVDKDSSCYNEKLYIPSTVNGITVTSIGTNAFLSHDLSLVTIANSVTRIGWYAFKNNQLTSVVIPNSVTRIEGESFRDNKLTSVVIPDSVTFIDNHAFADNQLTSVVISNSLASIRSGVFQSNKLTSVVIPNSVTSIEGGAFRNNQLTSVVIPNSVIKIGSSAFQSNQLVTVTIPNSVTSIGTWAFANNQLTSVVIPNSVTSIENYVFHTNSLTSISIPNSVTSIGFGSFQSNQLVTVTIPNSVTTIDNQAFCYNQLTSVVIPNSVTSIGGWAFENNRLTSVIIPDSLTFIDISTFAYNQLTSVVIPNSVTSIGVRAFENNILTSVVIPNSVTNIGIYAFRTNPLGTITLSGRSSTDGMTLGTGWSGTGDVILVP